MDTQPFYVPSQPQMQVGFNPHQPQHIQPPPPPAMMMMGPMNKVANENLTTALVVRKVPKELNCEDKLREHFENFGTIINIITNYNNMPDAALVKFSTHQEALAAYKCPQSVLNNRFIRLFWFNQQPKWQNKGVHNQPPQIIATDLNEPTVKKHVKERLDFNNISTTTVVAAVQQEKNGFQQQQQQQSFNNEQYNKENKILKESKSIVVSPSGSLTKTVFNPDLLTTSVTATVEPTQSKSTEQTMKVPAPPAAIGSTKLVNVESPKNSVKTQQRVDERVSLIFSPYLAI